MQQNLLARCIAHTPSLTAGILLYRVCYWHSRAKISIGGKTWIAKSREDWCAETALSMKQCRSALEGLRQHQLIEIEQHHFGTRNVTHLRLKDRGLGVLSGLTNDADLSPEPGTDAAFAGQPDVAQTGISDTAQTGQLHIQGDTIKEIQTSLNYVKTHAQEDVEIKVDSGGDHLYESVVKEDTDLVTCKEILASPVGKHSKSPKAPGALTELRSVWIKGCGVYVGTLTGKAEGQLKLFAKQCPPGQAAHVMQTALDNWVKFAFLVKDHAGLKNVPSMPELGFLLNYVGHAVEYAKEPVALPGILKGVVPQKKTKSVQLTAKLPADEVPTADQLKDIFNDV